MTLLQLKYAVTVAEEGSITRAAARLYIAQPSLSSAVRELEDEIGEEIFLRGNRGITVTPAGTEFLSYARQIVLQAGMIEEKYIHRSAAKTRFSVSSQHYSFASAAFVSLIKACGAEAYEFTLREGKTHDIIEDVRTMRSEMGIIYMSRFNEAVIGKMLHTADLAFMELFCAEPHIFVGRSNPLALREAVTLEDIADLPCLTYDQGDQNALYFSEEILSTMDHARSIRVTDKGTIIDLMTSTDGYTISSGMCPSYLRGDNIVSIPLKVDEVIRVGVITHKSYRPTQLGSQYLDELKRITAGVAVSPAGQE